jgi:hypothetical protein
MAVLRSTGSVTRLSRQLAAATSSATEVLEDLRAVAPGTLASSGVYPDVAGPAGTTIHQRYVVSAIPGTSTALLITASATFADDEDATNHTVTLQLVRTTLEKL